MQGRREGSRAPTQPQGTEKTTIYNLAEGRGESQEEQPTPWTIQKNGLEGRQEKAEELDPTRKVGKSDWKITVQKRRDTNRYATRRWRGTIQATKVAKTDIGANQESPRGERLEQEGPREREIWAEENEKKDWKPGAPDKSQQKGNRPTGRNHEQPARNPGNRHKGGKPRPGKLTPTSQPEEQPEPENPRITPPNRTRRQTRRQREDSRRSLANK